MATDPNPALRAELEAALAVIDPQIRGLHDLAVVSISEELATAIKEEIAVRERRQQLLNMTLGRLDSVVDALEELEADGYPALPDAALPPDLFAELQGEDADLDAGSGVFVQTVATSISIDLGSPVERPTNTAETP